MRSINNSCYVFSMHIPCGNLDEDFINIQLKLKIMQLLTGSIDVELLDPEISFDDFIHMINSEYNPPIKLIPNKKMEYQEDVETFYIEFKMIPIREVNIEDYLTAETLRYIALGLYLDSDCNGEEYYTKDTIDYESTYMEMTAQAIEWQSIIDISEPGLKFSEVTAQLASHLLKVIYLGEVAVCILDTEGLYNLETVEDRAALNGEYEVDFENLSHGMNLPYEAGFVSQSIKEQDEICLDQFLRELNSDKDWSSF